MKKVASDDRWIVVIEVIVDPVVVGVTRTIIVDVHVTDTQVAVRVAIV